MAEGRTSKIRLQKLGELRLQKPLEQNRPAYIAAASGLIRHGDYCFVIGDDELHLGQFRARDLAPIEPLRLRNGDLPHEFEKRKKAKPDFEGLALLPPTDAAPHGAVLALGSGSRATRNAGVVVALGSAGLPHRRQSLAVDFTGLYTALQREFGTVNIEGAVVQGENFLLLQRGNKSQRINAVVRLRLDDFLQELWRGAVSANALHGIATYQLGDVAGVPLGFSDATVLPDGRLLALAVAEDTADAYQDGAATGSCLCVFDRRNELQRLLQLDTPAKAEGVAVWSVADKTLAFVTDADDVEVPAVLYTACVGDLF